MTNGSMGKVSTVGDHVPLRTKLSFALGGAAEGAVTWAFTGFNFIIYTVGFGLPGTLAGIAVFLSILLDAVSDPLIGYISDRWRSKLGRRHPFIYMSALPLGATILCIYMPPDVLLSTSAEQWSIFGVAATPEQWGLTVWLFIFASLLKFFHTCYTLPHLSLGSELTHDYLERTRIFRYNMLFSFGGGAALSWTFYNVFFPSGPALGMDTSWFAASVAIFGAVLIFLTAHLTRDQIPKLAQPRDDLPKFTLGDFFRETVIVFQNRNYLMLFFGLVSLSIMVGVRETLNANMGLYYWELPPGLMGLMPLFSMASFFVAVIVVAKANQILEKGGTARIAVAFCVSAAAIPVLLRSFGLLPENGHSSIFWIVGLSVFLYYGSLAVLTTTVYSAIGDVVDEHELATGQRQEGIFYAVRTFFGKMTNGIGHLFAGIAIDVIGFPPGAVVGEVDPEVIFQLGIFDGVIAGIPTLLAIYFYGKYKINKTRHREILDELAARREAALAS